MSTQPSVSPASPALPPKKRSSVASRCMLLLHLVVIALAAVMIVYITYDTLRDISFIADPRYLRLQFWACLVFIIDVVIESLMSERKWHYFLGHFFFLLICIPYLNIVSHFGIRLSNEVAYMLRFLPMLRAAYVLALVSGGISKNWVQNMFSVYIILVVTILYFCSLLFFVDEHYLNPGVKDYWDSLWFCVMALTTTGSNINPVTPAGMVISVVLSACGLILFPVFTVFLTNRLTHNESPSSQ